MPQENSIKDVKWTPYPWQSNVISSLSKARYITIVTGNRVGKSYLLRRIAFFLTVKYGTEDNCTIWAGQNFKAITRNIVRKVQKEWGQYVDHYDKQEHTIWLTTGHPIYLISAENLASIEGLADTVVVLLDEICMLDEEILDRCDARAMDCRAPMIGAGTAIKNAPGALFVQDQFDKGLNPKYCGDDVDYFSRYASFTATMWDVAKSRGGHLADAEIDNFMARRSQEEVAIRVYGKFASIGNREFDRDTLTAEKFGYRERELDNFRLEHYLFQDPGTGKRASKDESETALVVVGIAPKYGIYVREVRAAQFTVSEVQTNVIDLCRKYKIHKVGVETVTSQILWLDILRKAQQISDAITFIPLERGPLDSKPTRHGLLLPFIESGRLKCPVDEHGNFLNGTDKLVKQMKNAPYGHDDCLDALSDVANPKMGIIEGVELPHKRREEVGPLNTVLSKKEYAGFMDTRRRNAVGSAFGLN